MRLATVIGRVTLSVRHPAFRGERLLLAQPWTAKSIGKENVPHGPAIVVYDELGASPGQIITISEGAEATRPFAQSTPVDAYCAALVDTVFHQPSDPRAIE
ncbi:MAG: EutN/CcmL family microcompartment protein [Opitutaceae bacterium]